MMENQCCLCGKEGGKEIAEGICVCDDCMVEAVTETYERRNKKPWYHTKRNWGMYILLGGFLAYLITWFVIKPMLEKGG